MSLRKLSPGVMRQQPTRLPLSLPHPWRAKRRGRARTIQKFLRSPVSTTGEADVGTSPSRMQTQISSTGRYRSFSTSRLVCLRSMALNWGN